MPAEIEPFRPPHRVYLVRHGRTALNAEGRFQGRLDEPLDFEGLHQAERIGGKLREFLESGLRDSIELWTSPLARAAVTMDIIADRLGRERGDISVAPELAEMGFGRWEGLTTDEVRERFPAERKQRRADRWGFTIDGGNSHADLANRFTRWISGLDGPALAVTHLGVMRAASVTCGGCDRETALRVVPRREDIWMLSDNGLKVL